MNNAPFYIGQRIVRIKKNISGVKIGDRLTCAGCFMCKCGDWKVSLSELPNTNKNAYSTCKDCGHNNGSRGYYNGSAKYFAPIEENTYEDVTKELAVLPQDEVPDVKTIKELVN